MLELTPRNIKTWSRMGVRATYGLAMFDLAQRNPKIMTVSADLGRSSGLKQLMDKCPNQYVNTGIAEQNMIGIAAGLAREGYAVFASSFAPFISMRASEQVRMNLGYMQHPVKLVGLGSGVAMGFLGNSHYGIEDMAVMRSIPGMTIVSPADCAELIKTLEVATTYELPLYIRLTGSVNTPIVYEADYHFRIGHANHLKEGNDLCIIAIGSMVKIGLDIALRLEASQNKSVHVINFHTLKPLDKTTLKSTFEKFPTIITIEEHTILGGLGSAVAEFKTQHNYSSQVISYGIQDCFLEAGDYAFTLNEAELTVEKIYQKIINQMAKA